MRWRSHGRRRPLGDPAGHCANRAHARDLVPQDRLCPAAAAALSRAAAAAAVAVAAAAALSFAAAAASNLAEGVLPTILFLLVSALAVRLVLLEAGVKLKWLENSINFRVTGAESMATARNLSPQFVRGGHLHLA